ncbi:MAG: nucleoside phosphorylase [Oscillospiraceae bacterium]|nr:nucleoside phosphorylase [Oscillospiraceae bacterium]
MQYLQNRPLAGSDGRLKFTGLRPGQLADTVLMPGDPQRSEIISSYFKKADYIGQRSTFAAYTGETADGTPLSVVSSGMGCMCVSVALEEFAHVGVKNVIRVGTCAAIQPEVQPGTLMIASGCVRGEGASYEYAPAEYPAVADYKLVSALTAACRECGETPDVGLYRAHDSFYMESMAAHEGLKQRMQIWQDTNVRAVENESGTLFTMGYLLGIRTASICVALGYMLADHDMFDANIYPAYKDPDFLKKRIEVASRVSMRAAEILRQREQEGR